MKIVFFGTPEFAVASLDALVKNGFDVAAVVTMPDKAAGRGQHISMSDVKKYALEHNLPLLQPVKLKDPDFLEQLKAVGADLFYCYSIPYAARGCLADASVGHFQSPRLAPASLSWCCAYQPRGHERRQPHRRYHIHAQARNRYRRYFTSRKY